MKLIFATMTKNDLYERLQSHLHFPINAVDISIEVRPCSILDVECDAVVSPANSFGFMNGGIDSLYLKRFGIDLQYRLQKQIKYTFNGELLVGQATAIQTYDAKISWLIAAPTMRVPMILGPNTINPYLAMKAILNLIRFGESVKGVSVAKDIQIIAIPGLGTGIGKVSANICALQISEALREPIGYMPESWMQATKEHQALMGSNQFIDLQKEMK